MADTADIRAVRDRLTPAGRDLINAVWAHYRARDGWPARPALEQQFGSDAIRAAIGSLGARLIREQADDGSVRLTLLGVLLTSDGPEAEHLLVRYLQHVRDRYRTDPKLEWVGSRDVETALALTPADSRLLAQLLRLSHWWGGGSAFGEREWTVGLPIDVDDLATEVDLARYIHAHVLADVPAETRAGAAEEHAGQFGFVGDARLRARLAADWHEAQDVCHVLGWKSCVILCGGILETVLTHACTALKGRLALDRLVAVAEEQGVLQPGTVRVGPALRASRTFLSPERSARFALTRADADAALAAVRSCLDQLGGK